MKRNTLEHPKVRALARELGLERWGAVGILESLWCWAGRYAPRGDIGRWDLADLADGIGWTGDPEKLIGAMVETGWLDGMGESLTIHDWADHADDATRKALERSGETFSTGEAPRSHRRRDKGETPATPVAPSARLPEPEPEPEPGSPRLPDGRGVQNSPQTENTAPAPKPRSRGHPGVALFVDLYRRHRRADCRPTGRDAKAIKAVTEAVGIERLELLLPEFFGLSDDRWVVNTGFSGAALEHRYQACLQRAEKRAQYEARERERADLGDPADQMTEADIELLKHAGVR